MTPDGKLVRRAIAGRGEAFSELVLRWTHRVLALCHALVRQRQAAEELTQETFVRAYVALSRARCRPRGTLRELRFGDDRASSDPDLRKDELSGISSR